MILYGFWGISTCCYGSATEQQTALQNVSLVPCKESWHFRTSVLGLFIRRGLKLLPAVSLLFSLVLLFTLIMGKDDKLRVVWRTGLALLKSINTCTSGFFRINFVSL